MISNEQAIQAFREVLNLIETYAVRADAIYELMLERSEINRLDLEQTIETARTRQKVKWDQIRANVESLLKEEAVCA